MSVRTRAAAALGLATVIALTVAACSAGPGTPSETAPEVTALDVGPPTRLDLPIEPWWGGSSYYADFEKAAEAGWTEDSFFPIAVFYGKPEHAASLAEIGINTYMGAEHDGSPMSAITGAGISVVAQSEWTPEEVGEDPLVVGWHVSDECDMGYSGCTTDWENDNGEHGRLAVQQGYAAQLRALQDGRFLQANFGNGVLGTYWAPSTMDDHVALLDVSSVDKYAYTSPTVRDLLRSTPLWPARKDPTSAGAYGWQQDRMEEFADPVGSTPNWVFVETARPYLEEDDADTITSEQIEGAVWNAIIHGAAGIAYFQQNNDGCGNYSLVECSAQLRTDVTRINADVSALAPLLNSPSHEWTFGPGLETSLKAAGEYAYVLAMTDGGTGARTLTLPPAVQGGTVEVIGEERTIPIEDGAFTDDFAAEHEHHVYRIRIDR